MKIGIVSSWHEKCGISEFSNNLVNGLLDKDLQVKVVGNYPKDQLELDEPYVKRYFHTPFLTHNTTANIKEIADYLADCHIVHFQFETSLYHPNYFSDLLKALKPRKIILTMHSSGMWHGFDCSLVDCFITMEQMWCTNYIIQMPVKFQEDNTEPDYNEICSFGLGRNNDDWLKAAIKDTDIKYKTSYGTSKWLKMPDLVKEIQKSWVASLLYPEVGANVGSSAACLALGANRPLLITNTNWFKHLIGYPGLYVCEAGNIKDIKENIEYLMNPSNRNDIKGHLSNMKELVISKGQDFDSFIKKHINLYKSFV